jgi:hypothetical protein
MTNIFDRSYRFYEAGAPFPGVCLACSNVNKLWDLGMISGTNRGAYLCDMCLQDLALFAGFVLKAVYEKDTSELKAEVAKLENQIEASPRLIKELTQNVNSLLGEFVTSLASVASTNKPVQPEGNKADTGDSSVVAGATEASSKGTAKITKPSVKSASK